MFILDTDVISNLRKKRPHPSLTRWIGEIGWQELATTALTVMEIQIGIERARRSDATIADTVQKWLSGLLHVGRPEVLPLGTDAALLLGRMYETPPLRNFLANDPGAKKPKTGADLAIASIAIAHSAIVATGNGSDFLLIHRYFPLRGLYDPFEDKWLVQPSD
ncbi:MAG: PIN domain-containing protein [Steroidobacteraceae bacterium]